MQTLDWGEHFDQLKTQLLSTWSNIQAVHLINRDVVRDVDNDVDDDVNYFDRAVRLLKERIPQLHCMFCDGKDEGDKFTLPDNSKTISILIRTSVDGPMMDSCRELFYLAVDTLSAIEADGQLPDLPDDRQYTLAIEKQIEDARAAATNIKPPNPTVLLPRPKGKRPLRINHRDPEHLPWIKWEQAIFSFVDGGNYGAQKCWDQHKVTLLTNSRVVDRKEFTKIHGREYEKLKRQKKLLTKKIK